MAHLRAKFHGDPTKTVEKLMFRTREGYVYDVCVFVCPLTPRVHGHQTWQGGRGRAQNPA